MRPRLIAICLSLLPLAAFSTPPAPPSPPPPPPPPPERLAAAVAIWIDHPLPEGRLAGYAEFRVRETVVSMLDSAGVKRGGKNWIPKYSLLARHFLDRIGPNVGARQQRFIECLATPYTGMEVERLRELRAFLATDTGKQFWDASGLGEKDGFDCSLVFQDDIMRFEAEGWRVLGVKPPPPPPMID